MAISTPICNFGEKSHNFSLTSTEGKFVNLNDIKGENGYLIMFICNHCPYVQAIINFLVDDAKYLESKGITNDGAVSIVEHALNGGCENTGRLWWWALCF